MPLFRVKRQGGSTLSVVFTVFLVPAGFDLAYGRKRSAEGRIEEA